MIIQKYACILSKTLLAMSQIFYYIEVDIINIFKSFNHLFKNIFVYVM